MHAHASVPSTRMRAAPRARPTPRSACTRETGISQRQNAPILLAAAWACSLANFAGSMVLMVVDRGGRARGLGLGTRRRREKIKVCTKTCAYNSSQGPRGSGAYLITLFSHTRASILLLVKQRRRPWHSSSALQPSTTWCADNNYTFQTYLSQKDEQDVIVELVRALVSFVERSRTTIAEPYYD